MDLMKIFFTQRLLRLWNRVPRNVVESLSLGVFKNLVAVMPKGHGLAVDLAVLDSGLRGLFQL